MPESAGLIDCEDVAVAGRFMDAVGIKERDGDTDSASVGDTLAAAVLELDGVSVSGSDVVGVATGT